MVTLALFTLGCAALAFLCYIVVALGCGSDEPDSTHTEEIYHGNWWSTWYTPVQMKLIDTSIILTIVFFVASIVLMLI